MATEAQLPVDPLEDAPPVDACAECGGELVGEPDVMDTWMTSSLTPLINANWAETEGRVGNMELHPLTVRVQAFEIIRTWLFYTVTKSHLHCDSLPWRDVMISGWGLNEQGKKISKRDLEKSTDKSGFNRYEPYQVIQKYGGDSLRYWATGANLGHDLRYNERDVRNGKKLLTKLWNASRFGLMQLEGFDPSTEMPLAERTAVDRWIWYHCNQTIERATKALDGYDFATARDAIDRFFWHYLCDYYLEMIKDRFWTQDAYSDAARTSAQVTLWAVLRRVIGLYAIYLPHITEELYQRIFAEGEGGKSVHLTAWPSVDPEAAPVEAVERLTDLLGAVRAQRTAVRLANSRRLEKLVVECPESWQSLMEPILTEMKAAARVDELVFGPAESETSIEGLKLTLVPQPPTD